MKKLMIAFIAMGTVVALSSCKKEEAPVVDGAPTVDAVKADAEAVKADATEAVKEVEAPKAPEVKLPAAK